MLRIQKDLSRLNCPQRRMLKNKLVGLLTKISNLFNQSSINCYTMKKRGLYQRKIKGLYKLLLEFVEVFSGSQMVDYFLMFHGCLNNTNIFCFGPELITREFHGSPVGSTWHFHCRGQVQSLVGKLRYLTVSSGQKNTPKNKVNHLCLSTSPSIIQDTALLLALMCLSLLLQSVTCNSFSDFPCF